MSNMMRQEVTQSKRTVKSRAGCTRCKQRRIKCDETRPSCLSCSRRGYDCPGYQKDVKWAVKRGTKVLSSESVEESLGSSNKESHMSWFTESAEKLRVALLSDLQPPVERSQACKGSSTRPINTRSLPPKNIPQFETSDSDRCDGRTDVPGPSFASSGSAFTLQTSKAVTSAGRRSNAKLSSPLTDSSTKLREYYFSHICRILSAYDSQRNPLREWVARLSTEHSLIHSCVLSISAAHVSQKQQELSMLAISHHTATLSNLAAGIRDLGKWSLSHSQEKAGQVSGGTESVTALLLGIIIIGMTSSWNAPSSLGMQHLNAARTIFQSSCCESHSRSSPISYVPRSDDPLAQKFFVGALAYWEALTSFVVDKNSDAADYLLRFCDEDESSISSVHPWSGISPKLFIFVSRIGSLARQAHHLRQALTSPASRNPLRKDRQEILLHAKHLEELVCQYKLPSEEQFHDTCDSTTPVNHFRILGRAYQLSIMLELCRIFPELLCPDQPGASSCSLNSQREIDYGIQRKHLNTLAITILTLIAMIPETSGTRATQMLALVIAGSTLQFQRIEDMDVNMEGISADSDCTPLPYHTRAQADIKHWRLFVDSRLNNLASHVGLDTVHRACMIVRESWARADWILLSSPLQSQAPIVHWIDIMIENKSETIIG